MRKIHSADNITAGQLAGYATEMALWQFIHDISRELAGIHACGEAHGRVNLDNVRICGDTFVLTGAVGGGSAADDMWQLGSCIYELVAGTLPFGGRGRSGQEETSPLPVFSTARASEQISLIARRCMLFDERERIKADDVLSMAEKGLAAYREYASDTENLKYKKPQNRPARMKTYSFWPEAMSCIVLILMLAVPQKASAQYNAEMEKLIRLTTSMRDQSKRAQVLDELRNDEKWTLMDELSVDMNECTYGDKVDMFGVNDIAAEIAQKDKGIINSGGRFKHSADGKHQYSFIELTARAGKTITYDVRGHAGTQHIAIVPFDKSRQYTAVFFSDGDELTAHTQKDGISYFTVEVGKRGNYEFEITNNGSRNASFVVITYNTGM